MDGITIAKLWRYKRKYNNLGCLLGEILIIEMFFKWRYDDLQSVLIWASNDKTSSKTIPRLEAIYRGATSVPPTWILASCVATRYLGWITRTSGVAKFQVNLYKASADCHLGKIIITESHQHKSEKPDCEGLRCHQPVLYTTSKVKAQAWRREPWGPPTSKRGVEEKLPLIHELTNCSQLRR